ncbi:MAG: hypothetical protein J2P37_32955 [Ktedonobacteraceae bacterium]|nr:hypothetical protein [Ktedonobacteraceae bacterium]
MNQQPASPAQPLAQIRPLPDVLATVGMILGLVGLASLILLPLLWPLTLVDSISGWIFSLLGRRTRRRGQALAGLICSIIALVVAIPALFLFTRFSWNW